jgi:hypothetical protein
VSRTVILSTAHHADPNTWAGLRDTCALFGAPLHVLGTDKPLSYASNDPRLFTESVPDALAFLDSCDAEYIVVTDAFDVLCCRWDEGELITRINAARGNLIVSCEAACFPEGSWRAHYDALSPSPWRYPNAGQFCGTRSAVVAFVRALDVGVRAIPGPYSPVGGAAQEVLHRMICAGRSMSLDSQCSIFQSMYTGAVEHVGWTASETGPSNHLSGSHPMFMHFNGRAPGMDLWYRLLTGKRMPRHPMRPEYMEVR